MIAHFILFVDDQSDATAFFTEVLGLTPRLHEPGMTEFALGRDSILGLMPRAGAQRLLGLKDPALLSGTGCELYLSVDDPAQLHARALAAGATELSPLAARDWGDEAAYSRGPQGHIVAFARRLDNR
ncbi:MAG: VOC family protein [Frankiaceae bacterium]|nr:VOC family protein [Frankiaceae bacterium]